MRPFSLSDAVYSLPAAAAAAGMAFLSEVKPLFYQSGLPAAGPHSILHAGAIVNCAGDAGFLLTFGGKSKQ